MSAGGGFDPNNWSFKWADNFQADIMGTVTGAEAAVQGMAHLNELHVYDLQGMHASLSA